MALRISKGMLNALSILLPEEVKYLCIAQYLQKYCYLVYTRECLYFVSEELDSYKDPPVPYSFIMAVCTCPKQKTLVQLRLKPPADGMTALRSGSLGGYGAGHGWSMSSAGQAG